MTPPNPLCIKAPAPGVPGPTLPSVTHLYAPYPNPVTDGAHVRLDLAGETEVSLEIHDVQGRRVATLADGRLPAGRNGERAVRAHRASRINGRRDPVASAEDGISAVPIALIEASDRRPPTRSKRQRAK